ncbi:TldD/PmbA family protein [Patescibacteria group bacterium]|nr:TldD/PmbA family protein [Patescibacteria group bacterium]
MGNYTLAKKLLKQAKTKSTAAEVVCSEGYTRGVSFEHSKLKIIGAKHSVLVGLRLIKNGRVGVAATNDIRRIDDLVGKALAVSEFGPEALFEFPKAAEYQEVAVFDSSVKGISEKKFVDLGHKIINDIHEFNPKILCHVDFGWGEGRSLLLNTSGLEVEDKASSLDFSVLGDWVKEGDMLSVGEGKTSCREDVDYDFCVERVKEKFSQAKDTAKIKTGQYPVIFTPSSFGSVISYIFTALSGKTVVKGSSKLRDKLGQRVFDKDFSVIDDGLIDWKTGSGKIDDEGVSVKKLFLIKKGEVKNFYYDLQSAAQAGAKNTGHGVRGATAALGSPGLHNVLVDGGKASYKSILSGIEEGILAEDFLGVGQDNPFNGDFSMNLALGYKIEKGRIVGRLKDTMIAGNAFELLDKGLRALSQEREWVGGSFCCPYVVLEPVAVVSA